MCYVLTRRACMEVAGYVTVAQLSWNASLETYTHTIVLHVTLAQVSRMKEHREIIQITSHCLVYFWLWFLGVWLELKSVLVLSVL